MSSLFAKVSKYLPPVLKCAPFLIGNYGKTVRWGKHPERYDFDLRYEHQRKTYQKVTKALNVTVEYQGLEKVPNIPHMIVSNHQSFFDPFLSAGFKGQYINVAKTSIAKFPFVGWIAKITGTVFLNREDLKEAVRVNKRVTEIITVDKRNIWMTAEGTRSKKADHEMNEFKPGSIKGAFNAQCPIVPVCFDKSWCALDPDCKGKIKVYVHVLDPIPYEEYSKYSTSEFAEMLHTIVHDELLRMREEKNNA